MSEDTKDVKKEEHKKEDHKEHGKGKKFFENPWKITSIASIALCIVLVALIVAGLTPVTGTTSMITADAASQKALTFIKENMVREGTEVNVNNISEEQGLYKMTIEVKSGSMSQEVETYISKDGRLFFPQAIDIDAIEQESTTEEVATTEEVTKSDKPEAQAFVMSYCPYGLQFMKAYVPVMELLGDKADLKINFVNYAMHGKKELDENLRMYCIQKEQKSKFTDYLRCFVEKDNYTACIETAGVDYAKLDSCIEATDEEFNITELYNDKSTWSGGAYPRFPVEDELNDEFEVGGSPTFVLNGKILSVTRSAEAIKSVICSAFNTPPEECNEELSDQAEQPGIGAIGSGSDTTSGGSCG